MTLVPPGGLGCAQNEGSVDSGDRHDSVSVGAWGVAMAKMPSCLFVASLLVLPIALAGCGSSTKTTTSTRTGGSSPNPSASTSGSAPGASSNTPRQSSTPSTSPSFNVISSVITYDWAWPNNVMHPGTVKHSYRVPPLPVLRAISVGRHESDHPAYDRISFTFAGTFPSYDLKWVSEVVADGSGQPVHLEGDGALRIRFTQAAAHDASGSTLDSAPPVHLGYPAISSYAQAGDFEGVLTYGVGNSRTIHESNGQIPRVAPDQQSRGRPHRAFIFPEEGRDGLIR
jgi:hypothetical protein